MEKKDYLEREYSASPLVSVIVPVYNVKPYLAQCIESLICQSLKNIEIILVDDGSTDGSGELCDMWKSDPRVRVLHKKNEGLSQARNDGIDMACAEYIMFVDGDDWVEPEFCEIPYRIAVKEQADIVCFCYSNYQRGRKPIKVKPYENEGWLSEADALSNEIKEQIWKKISVVAWNKLYRIKMFHEIRYPVGRVYEDLATTHKLLHMAGRVWLVSCSLYNHRKKRPGSITNTRSLGNSRDYYWAFSQWTRNMEEWGFDCSKSRQMMALSYLVHNGRKVSEADQWIKILQETDHLPSEANWKRCFIFRIFRFSPVLFDFLCIATGRRRKM